MAPEGHGRAMAATSSAAAASGWIHSPDASGTNTSGRPSMQFREWMHFLPSKRTAMLLPRYSWGLSLTGSLLGMGSGPHPTTWAGSGPILRRASAAQEGGEEGVR